MVFSLRGTLQNCSGNEAGVDGQTVVMENLVNLALILTDFELDEVSHLPVAILLDDEDLVMLGHEGPQLRGEGKRAQTEVTRGQPRFHLQLMARLLEGEVGRAVSDQTDAGPFPSI